MMLRRGLATSASLARGAARRPLPVKVGDLIEGFRVNAIDPVPPYDMHMLQMVHERTGAEYVHIDTADTNNTFAVIFRTPPTSDNGVAHILEHTALCGSKQFPVRDPFFHMLRRSLQNFMNALTGPDYTMYPFSTSHVEDFGNLLSVYCDAVFNPLLTYNDFRQEGHRLEHEIWHSPESPVQIKGIVYNEMKGAMSDPASVLHQELCSRMFPHSAYRFNSGGEPHAITSLTHEELVEFHRRHYHPSNARFFSYGDLPPQLRYLNETVLSRFERCDVNTEVSLQFPFDKAPAPYRFMGPPDSMVIDPQKQTTVTKSFLCMDIPSADPVDVTAFSLISNLLLHGSDSPMHRALIAPNIGSGFSSVTGLMPMRQLVWSVGLQGVASSDVDKVADIIRSTIRDCMLSGFESKRVDAILHRYRLSQQEIRTQFGLNILNRVMPRWLHGKPPLPAMQLEAHLKEISTRMSRGPYLEQLMRRHLFDNTHQLTLVMEADPDYISNKIAAEDEKLKSTPIPEHIVEEAQALGEAQEKPQDTRCLPTLHTSDIPPENPNECTDITVDVPRRDIKSFFVHQPTNGLVYTDLLFETENVPTHLRHLLPLFCSVVASLGAAGKSYEEMSHLRSLYTGGVSASLHLFSPIYSLSTHSESITFRTSCLKENSEAALSLLGDIATSADFNDKGRLRQLITDIAASLSADIVESGHVYARMHAAARWSPCLSAKERFSGLTNASLMNTLAAKISSESTSVATLDQLSHDLSTIASSLHLRRSNVVADPDLITEVAPRVYKCLDRFVPGTARATGDIDSAWQFLPPNEDLRHFVGIPLEVNNVAMAVPCCVPYGHEDSAPLRTVMRIMSTEYMHRELREKGGAYGGGASWSSDGALTFFSYRDPNLDETLQAFLSACVWCCDEANITEERVEQAILSIFSSLDAPIHPASQGRLEFIEGITREQRLEHRSRLLRLTPKIVLDAANRHLANISLADAAVTVVGNESTDPAAIRKLDHPWKISRLAEWSADSKDPQQGDAPEDKVESQVP
ncbi:hypothetical protein PBRA_005210 [Plasmodiophora brassicae]|uniref:Peptidase M16C associated domain-containing protein n=1 Tax=Plasmodiophora brassicae TaxID=37360 RepID=A0A0G4IN20_PLABS|nr:hypothetical protein PBRA_005210 [Plasmodiophora brassicae]